MGEERIINDLLAKIEHQFGKEAAHLLGSPNFIQTKVFSSGSLVIDRALGIGGYPCGRIIEIFGPESAGKTTLALHAVAEIQKNGGIAAYIDVEHAIDPKYAASLGVDIDNLIVCQPDSGEQALDIVDILAKTGLVNLIVVDSVAALVPTAELEGEMKDQVVGGQARLMARALRKFNGALVKTGTTIIFINQLREKIGVMFGNPEVTPGGRALKFFAAVRMEVRKTGNVTTNSNEVSGTEIKIKVVKNKLASPFKTASTEIIFAQGISKQLEVIDLAEEMGIITKKGSWYQYDGKNIAQGRIKLRDLLVADPELFNNLYQKILVQLPSSS